MMALALEYAPTGSASPANRYVGYPSPDYEFGSTSSDDFATIKISQFRGKSVELTGFKILMIQPEGFVGQSQTQSRVAPTMTTDVAAKNPDLERAESRLSFLAQLDITESFEDLIAPSVEVIREAQALLRKLAALDLELSLPDIGLDSDGTIVFSFHPGRCSVIGSLSVFGDGTYSYCIEKDGRSVENGAAQISKPIAQDLQNFLVR